MYKGNATDFKLVVLQKCEELSKVYAFIVDFKRRFRRSHLEVVKSSTIHFVLKLLVEFYSQLNKV